MLKGQWGALWALVTRLRRFSIHWPAISESGVGPTTSQTHKQPGCSQSPVNTTDSKIQLQPLCQPGRGFLVVLSHVFLPLVITILTRGMSVASGAARQPLICLARLPSLLCRSRQIQQRLPSSAWKTFQARICCKRQSYQNYLYCRCPLAEYSLSFVPFELARRHEARPENAWCRV